MAIKPSLIMTGGPDKSKARNGPLAEVLRNHLHMKESGFQLQALGRTTEIGGESKDLKPKSRKPRAYPLTSAADEPTHFMFLF